MHYLKHPKFKNHLSNGLQIHEQNQQKESYMPQLLPRTLTHTCQRMLLESGLPHSYRREAGTGYTWETSCVSMTREFKIPNVLEPSTQLL